ncbi:MAG: sugar transferase [Candidatus Doudnabacteria bacterium]|nr:sugar transferase [Candidatus Doudnabacteria bacterium]
MKRTISFWLIIVPNLAIFYLSLWLVILLWYPQGLSKEQQYDHVVSFSVIYAIWLITFFSFRLFERETFRRYSILFYNLLTATIVNVFIAIGYFYFQPELLLTPRRFLLVHIVITFSFIFIWDLLIKWFVFSRYIQPVYFFSFNPELKYLEEEIKKHSYMGFKVEGQIKQEELDSLHPGDVVVFPDNLHADASMANTIFNFRNREIIFYNHNYFYETLLRRVYINSLSQIWFLQNLTYRKRVFFNLIKEIFDILIGVISICVFAITFPFVAILVKLTSSGPIFFKQERVGKDGKIFNIYKYRTMAVGTENDTWTEIGDQRITRSGKFLRLTRIDELPQSINLLIGNMSVVGPRPEQVGIVEGLKKAIPFYEERQIVKPGITGWAQLNIYARNLDETKIKLEYDLYYIKNQSVFMDFEIIVKTAYNILTFQGQ